MITAYEVVEIGRSDDRKSDHHRAAVTKMTDSNVVIRNLSVMSTDALTSDQVRGYFERFGEIELVQWHQINQDYYGFVQFKLEESAKAVLSQSNHRIGDVTPKVMAADDSLQPDYELILRMLDDDCLEHVLLQLKNLIDLSNAADVCVRFKNAANLVFKRKYQILDFDRNSWNFTDDSTMYKLFENILRNFGSMAHSINMIDNERTLELVSRYCIDNSKISKLQKLVFKQVHFTKSVVERFHNIFKQLTVLWFFETTFDTENVRDFFPFCTELKELWFWSTCSDQRAKQVLNNLLISNPKLSTLNIIMIDEAVDSVESFFQYLQAPHRLEIGFSSQYFTNFTMLTDLRIDFGYQMVSPVLKILAEKNNPIKHLALLRGVLDFEAFQIISKMKQLNRLILKSIYSRDLNKMHLVEWAKHLPELKSFSFDQCSLIVDIDSLKHIIKHGKKLKSLLIGMKTGTKIELNDYNTILEMVKSRNCTQLTCIFKCSEGKFNVPEDIQSKNKDWLNIQVFNHPETKIGFVLRIEQR